MISPYVRRLRLGAELRALRAAAGLTHEQVAKRIGESRAQISRLENGHAMPFARPQEASASHQVAAGPDGR